MKMLQNNPYMIAVLGLLIGLGCMIWSASQPDAPEGITTGTFLRGGALVGAVGASVMLKKPASLYVAVAGLALALWIVYETCIQNKSKETKFVPVLLGQ